MKDPCTPLSAPPSMDYTSIGSLWHEEKGFQLYRSSIGSKYIFLHFLTPVTAVLKGKQVTIHPGGCVFIPAYSKQQFSSPGYELIHDWFHADLSCGEFMKYYGIDSEIAYYPQDNSEISQLIHLIETEKRNRKPHYLESIDLLTRRLFILLSRADIHKPSGTPVNNDQKELFLKVRTEIQRDFTRNWTVEEMAQLAKMSPSRFYCLYKNFFGTTPKEDLIQRKIKHARWLLINNDYSTKKVAELCGYHNEYHFIRQFKQITGTTPGKYKQLFEEENENGF